MPVRLSLGVVSFMERFFFVVVEDLDSCVLAGYGGLGGFPGTFLEC